jgi:hypothetical protein
MNTGIRYFLAADVGGAIDDFVDSVCLFEIKDIDDLERQAREEFEDYWKWVERGSIRFLEIKTGEQAKAHIDFFHEELMDKTRESDTDCWRLSVDLPLLKATKKDILEQKDFKIKWEDIK